MIAPAEQEGHRRGMVSVTERGTQTEERYEAGTIIDRKRRARKRKLFVDKIAEEMTASTDYPQLDGIEFKRADRLSSPKRKRLLEEKIKPIEELTFDDIKKYNRNQLRAYCSVYGVKRKSKGEMEYDLAKYVQLFHPDDVDYQLNKFQQRKYAGVARGRGTSENCLGGALHNQDTRPNRPLQEEHQSQTIRVNVEQVMGGDQHLQMSQNIQHSGNQVPSNEQLHQLNVAEHSMRVPDHQIPQEGHHLGQNAQLQQAHPLSQGHRMAHHPMDQHQMSNTQQLPNGDDLPNGQHMPSGQHMADREHMSRGRHMSSEQHLSNGQHIPNEQHISTGQHIPNEQHISNGQHIPNEQHINQPQHIPSEQHINQPQHIPSEQHINQPQHINPPQHMPNEQHINPPQHMRTEPHINPGQHLPNEEHMNPPEHMQTDQRMTSSQHMEPNQHSQQEHGMPVEHQVLASQSNHFEGNEMPQQSAAVTHNQMSNAGTSDLPPYQEGAVHTQEGHPHVQALAGGLEHGVEVQGRGHDGNGNVTVSAEFVEGPVL